jgi:PKD repeat protein
MNRFLTRLLFLALPLFVFVSSAFGQSWAEMMADPTVNFYETQKTFEAYWEGRDHTEKGKGWKPFKRWEWFMEQRVYPDGDLTVMDREMAAFFQEEQERQAAGLRSETGNWTSLGPSVIPANGGGAGRCNFLRFDPSNSNILWTGSPGGGLWKSTTGGSTWINWNTDQLPVIGCTDLAIDPNNSQVLYLATGDGYGGDTYSIGVLKSTDGGLTWNTTGLNWNVSQTRRIRRLIIHPTNSNLLIAATSNGIYRTTNGGQSWTQVQTGNFYDLEFKPGEPTTLYATSTQFYRSTNGGSSWTLISNGLPASSGVRRMEIAVTPANANYVYILAARQSDSGFLGVYRSTDSGLGFTERANSPNLLGWNSNGGDEGGQGWYDLAIAASPTNANVVIVGGVNIWRSTNGGTSWSINGHWTGSGAPYVHADIHDLIFVPGNGTSYYAACDGGVFRTTNNGAAWTDLSNGLEIAQLYRIGLSATNPGLVISGWQDNGTNRLNGTAWRRVIGGDGMECIIDHANASIMYGALYYGNIRKSTNGGTSFSTIVGSNADEGVNSSGLWVTPYVMHPTNSQTLLVGKSALYRSTNGGTNWSELGAISGSGQIRAIAFAPSDPQVIYAARTNTIHRSTNGGTNFSNVTGSLPNRTITYVGVSNEDPNTVYVTYSGYNATEKVFRSVNGGSTWTNYSQGLPNLPVNCIVHEKGSNGAVYAGTDVGVYYRDATMSAWIPFNGGLPNVIVNELEIQYAIGKLRAATYGRGLWESDLYKIVVAPEAVMDAGQGPRCSGSPMTFRDISQAQGATRQWQFPGGEPAISAEAEPVVQFPNPGTYTVSLTLTNAAGSSTVQQQIMVNPTPEIMLSADKTSLYEGETVTLQAEGAEDYQWNIGGEAGPVLNVLLTQSGSVIVTGTAAGCSSQAQLDIQVHPAPQMQIHATAPGICQGDSLYLEAIGAATYFWPEFQSTDPVQALNPMATTTYVVQGWSSEGCLAETTVEVEVFPLPEIIIYAENNQFCTGEFVVLTASGAANWLWSYDGSSNASLQFPLMASISVTVEGTSEQGCRSQASLDLEALPLPELTLLASANQVCVGAEVVLTVSGANDYQWSEGPGPGEVLIFYPLENTQVSVIGFSDNGCRSTVGIQIGVWALPELSVEPESPAVCNGEDLLLYASGAAQYEWGSGAGSASTILLQPASSGAILLTGTSAEGCRSERLVEYTVWPGPELQVGASAALICQGAETTLQASGADAYLWAGGPAGSNWTVQPDQSGAYTVTGISSEGCVAEGSVFVEVWQPEVSVAYWPDPVCFEGVIRLNAGQAQVLADPLLPPGWALDDPLDHEWLFFREGGAAGAMVVQVQQGDLQCPFTLELPQWFTPSLSPRYDACGRFLQVDAVCADGLWFRMDPRHSPGTLEPLGQGRMLLGVSEDDLSRYRYAYQCPGICAGFSWLPADIASTPCQEGRFDLRVLPNPASGQARLEVRHEHSGVLQLQVWDPQGRLLNERQWDHPGGLWFFELDLSHFAAGGYFLRLRDAEGRVRTECLLVY